MSCAAPVSRATRLPARRSNVRPDALKRICPDSMDREPPFRPVPGCSLLDTSRANDEPGAPWRRLAGLRSSRSRSLASGSSPSCRTRPTATSPVCARASRAQPFVTPSCCTWPCRTPFEHSKLDAHSTSGMSPEPDRLPRLRWRRHQSPDRLEYDFELAVALPFQRRQRSREGGVRQDRLPDPHERAHDLDVHTHRATAA
jgi:hypothetical protein